MGNHRFGTRVQVVTSEPGRVRVGEGKRAPQQGTRRPGHAALTHTPDLATPTCSEGPNQMQWVIAKRRGTTQSLKG